MLGRYEKDIALEDDRTGSRERGEEGRTERMS